MTKVVRSLRKKIFRWHKTIGLIIGLPMLLTVVTGVLLQYPQLFGPDPEITTAMAIDPLQPDHWLRGTNFGLHHSFDQGSTWQEAPLMWSPGSIQKLVFSLDNSPLVYALGQDALLVSHDSGRIWEMLQLELPAGTRWRELMDLCLVPDGTLIVLTKAGLAQSKDGGLSWSTQELTSQEPESKALAFVHDLHTGYWMEAVGPGVITITAAGTTFLLFSGFLMVFLRKKKERRRSD